MLPSSATRPLSMTLPFSEMPSLLSPGLSCPSPGIPAPQSGSHPSHLTSLASEHAQRPITFPLSLQDAKAPRKRSLSVLLDVSERSQERVMLERNERGSSQGPWTVDRSLGREAAKSGQISTLRGQRLLPALTLLSPGPP